LFGPLFFLIDVNKQYTCKAKPRKLLLQIFSEIDLITLFQLTTKFETPKSAKEFIIYHEKRSPWGGKYSLKLCLTA
jgi:hypothetical protein